MNYKVLSFVPSIDPKKDNYSHAAKQLQDLIDSQSVQGWKYVRLEGVTTYVKPDSACFGLKVTPGYNTTKQMVVFEKN